MAADPGGARLGRYSDRRPRQPARHLRAHRRDGTSGLRQPHLLVDPARLPHHRDLRRRHGDRTGTRRRACGRPDARIARCRSTDQEVDRLRAGPHRLRRRCGHRNGPRPPARSGTRGRHDLASVRAAAPPAGADRHRTSVSKCSTSSPCAPVARWVRSPSRSPSRSPHSPISAAQVTPIDTPSLLVTRRLRVDRAISTLRSSQPRSEPSRGPAGSPCRTAKTCFESLGGRSRPAGARWALRSSG